MVRKGKELQPGPTLKKKSNSSWLLVVFIFVFAAIGAYFLFTSFAAKKPKPPPTTNTPPTVSIDSPKNGAIVHGVVPVTATASDNGSVAGVQFMLNGSKIGDEDTEAPYSVDWTTPPAGSKAKVSSSYKLTAIARDDAGLKTTSQVVTVKIDNHAPTIRISAPLNAGHVKGRYKVKLMASDDTGVVGIQLKLDNKNLGEELAKGVTTYTWDTTDYTSGEHKLVAIARDGADNSTTSDEITVTIDSQTCTDTKAPSVPDGLESTSTTGSKATLSWNAASDTGCSGLKGYKLYRDGEQVNTTAETSYTDSGLRAGHTYTYTVSSYDGSNNESSQSAEVEATTKGSSGGGGGGGSSSSSGGGGSHVSGDANGDGHVNIRDLSIVLSRFGNSTKTGDLNSDGVVNIRDLSIVLSRFGR